MNGRISAAHAPPNSAHFFSHKFRDRRRHCRQACPQRELDGWFCQLRSNSALRFYARAGIGTDRGIKVLILGLGGAGQTPLSRQNLEAAAVSIVERALALGIRYFDTAANYGPSEDYLGKVLPAHRQRIFLASKTDARDRDGAWRDLERLLKRLKTD